MGKTSRISSNNAGTAYITARFASAVSTGLVSFTVVVVKAGSAVADGCSCSLFDDGTTVGVGSIATLAVGSDTSPDDSSSGSEVVEPAKYPD